MPTSPVTRFVVNPELTITPDTCVAITHNSEAEATTHPVEDGSSIADHVIRKPNKLSLTTIWTPNPIDDTYQPSGDERGLEAFQILTAVLQARTAIEIQCDGVSYGTMVLQNVSMQRQFADGDSRTIQVEAQEIQIVSGKTVKVKIAPSLKGKGKKKKTNVTVTRGQLAISTAAAIASGNWIGAAALVTAF